MKTGIAISDDYASLYTEGDYSWEENESKLSFYYGYEVTKDDCEDGEWMFEVRQNGKVLKSYTTSEIEKNSGDNLGEMSEYLLVGINMYLNGV